MAQEKGRPLTYSELWDSRPHRYYAILGSIVYDKCPPEFAEARAEEVGLPKSVFTVGGCILGATSIGIGGAFTIAGHLWGNSDLPGNVSPSMLTQAIGEWTMWSNILVSPLRGYNAFKHDKAMPPLTGIWLGISTLPTYTWRGVKRLLAAKD